VVILEAGKLRKTEASEKKNEKENLLEEESGMKRLVARVLLVIVVIQLFTPSGSQHFSGHSLSDTN
jgi:hypothetical protein